MRGESPGDSRLPSLKYNHPVAEVVRTVCEHCSEILFEFEEELEAVKS